MAIGLADVVQIIDQQTLFGQTVLNVYHYRVTDIGGSATDYLSAFLVEFRDNVVNVVNDIQGNLLNHAVLSARNLSNGVDIASLTVNVTGGVTAAEAVTMPPFVTYTFRLQRGSGATRHGYKRFAGVVEALAEGEGDLTDVAANIAAIRDALIGNLVLVGLEELTPIILGTESVFPGVEYTYSTILDVDYRGIGTQNTRKRGRGI